MEFKTVFYIIAAIAWFIYNTRDGWKKHQNARPVIKAPDLQPEPLKKVTNTGGTKPSKQFAQPIRNLNKPVETKKTIPSRTLNFRQKNQVETSSATIIPGFVEGGNVKILTNDSIQQANSILGNVENIPTSGQLIGEDLRGGMIDWKRAVVINELLRPVYF